MEATLDLEDIYCLFKDEGFIDVALVSLKESLSFDIYKAQIGDFNYGGMEFLRDHLKHKNPKTQRQSSALVALYPYCPSENELNSSLRVALYAQEKDYHYKINSRLSRVANKLSLAFPSNSFSHSVDSAPVLERDLAYRAGLGWIGKNTCLLSKEKGSLFYIAEILTDLPVENRPQLKTDHCGTCTRCIDACPTGALTPRKLEVDKCISYRNIEDRDCSPDTLEKKIDSWFFGCDVCQTVCPWNEKEHGKDEMQSLNSTFEVTDSVIQELKSILKRSNKQLDKDFRDFPLSRARGTGLKRNALKLIYGHRISSLKGFLENLEVSEQLQELKCKVMKSL